MIDNLKKKPAKWRVASLQLPSKKQLPALLIRHVAMPYESPGLANQKCRKLGVYLIGIRKYAIPFTFIFILLLLCEIFEKTEQYCLNQVVIT